MTHVFNRRGPLAAALLAVAFGTAGCNDLTMADVTGKVTLNGKPLEIKPPRGAGMVTFVPQDASENGRYAYGEIGPDGTFTMTTPDEGDGAVLGTYAVMISAGERDSDSEEASLVPLIPRKYGSDQTSGLTAEVKEGDNVVDLKLTGKPGK